MVLVIITGLYMYFTVDTYLYKGWNSNEYFHITYGYAFLGLLQVLNLYFMLINRSDIALLLNQVIRYFKNIQRKKKQPF